MNLSPVKTYIWAYLYTIEHYLFIDFSEDYIRCKKQIYGCGFAGLGLFFLIFTFFILAITEPLFMPSHTIGTNALSHWFAKPV